MDQSIRHKRNGEWRSTDINLLIMATCGKQLSIEREVTAVDFASTSLNKGHFLERETYNTQKTDTSLNYSLNAP